MPCVSCRRARERRRVVRDTSSANFDVGHQRLLDAEDRRAGRDEQDATRGRAAIPVGDSTCARDLAALGVAVPSMLLGLVVEERMRHAARRRPRPPSGSSAVTPTRRAPKRFHTRYAAAGRRLAPPLHAGSRRRPYPVSVNAHVRTRPTRCRPVGLHAAVDAEPRPARAHVCAPRRLRRRTATRR